MAIKYLYLLNFCLIFNACSGQSSSNKRISESNLSRQFEMPSVPTLITDPEKRAEYLVVHYWDKFDFKDTTDLSKPELTEQALTNYIDLMKYVSPGVAASSLTAMIKRTEVDSVMFAHFTNLFEKYLYDPNSPMRNEELYIPILQSVIASPLLEDAYKIRPAHLLEIALKNRLGQPAIDFTYTLANGQKQTLYNIKSAYLLLFFYNPECDACKEITNQLSASSLISEYMKQNKLKILAVYPDEDIEAWKSHISYMPATWINAYDKSVTLKNDEIYDLKAIPTLYLLDKDKKVILKDVTYQQTEVFLTQIQTK